MSPFDPLDQLSDCLPDRPPRLLPTAAISPGSLPRPQAIATDMDGTLTRSGRFSRELLADLERLQAAGIPLLIVTGRSAGWVSGLVEYLPIAGAIAENGGLLYRRDRPEGDWLVDLPDPIAHRQALAAAFGHLTGQFRADLPQLTTASDNAFRLTDWTFDLAGLPQLTPTLLDEMGQFLADRGWGFTYSAVQGHIKLPNQHKAAGLQRAIAQLWPDCDPKAIVTIGDSPNDESLFDRAQFPWSIGVANLHPYLDRLAHQPTYLTERAEGDGFCEVVDWLLSGDLPGGGDRARGCHQIA
ncbi:MAG: HAD family phosphatase [Oscillatoriales cyanobacterium]|nr:MAG: HAD family phosphatase [Oscillatoriales cyanobacterium]